MPPSEFVETLRRERGSAILRTKETSVAREAMNAAIGGGFKIVEFTLTIPGVYDLIGEFAGKPGLTVGAGTILTPEEAHRAMNSGAKFLVSPVLDEEVIRAASTLGVAMMPGCSTPTEMLRAHRLGAPLQKLFPAPGTGPEWVRHTLGPLPMLKIVPTSGVTMQNAEAYLDAGAWAVGFTASLFSLDVLAMRNYSEIEMRAKEMVKLLAKHRD
jgi:2-dehydro-3-deoxyphosphogluconate aldolase / (4S)-4-hydroxy-2-oxoglutarate aldolase